MAGQRTDEATRLLRRVREGDSDAEQELARLLYAELHELARGHMRGERSDHTLQPTALVHEVWLRLIDARAAGADSRGHFLALASRAMRSLLVDHARRRRAGKRGGGAQREGLEAAAAQAGAASDEEVVAVHEALERLAQADSELARLVELRFFGGLSMDDVAHALAQPKRTVERRWKVASVWLRGELGA